VLDPQITGEYSNTNNEDFQAAYFSVNRAYRSSPKCAWAMSDTTYQWVRKLTDDVGRPLLKIHDDDETIMGKPVLVCPSLPSYRASISDGKIVFGDFSHYVVHLSSIWLRRNMEAAGYVEYGKALYVGLQMADAAVIDPSGGTNPPLVYVALSA